ncbi:protein phosphatase 1 regulatory subunit 21 [Danaus plexippus]|uniref:protein phosphatase 1 regulatory subunit 21 n=1 Tax=Danaus plexippus TaxID=13037 RepID=UPI002AB0B930|nr:protein phosphatase 1 regulatory subunit 21 [Danaus plexippus]
MEGLPSGDVQAKYQKLASEYSKLRVHVKVLKKGVLDEQAKSNELRELLKEKEKNLRKGELEIDSLTFRNQQLTRRVSVLQDELDNLQSKSTKKSKSKDEKQSASNVAPPDSGVLQEELQKKIIENAQYASQLSDKSFEVSQLQASLEDLQRHMSESDSRYKCEIAKLKNKNQELQFTLEEIQRERAGNIHKTLNNQALSCNGDFLSEGGSLVGSEDALSSVDDSNINEQLSTKAHTLEQENEKLLMEYEILKMENESLKLDLSKYVAASQKRRGDTLDSGDFNTFSETSVDAEGRVTGVLGSLVVPFLASEEMQHRESRITRYYQDKLSKLSIQRDELSSKTEHYTKECEMLRLRFDELEREKETDARVLEEKHSTISRLEEELQSTSRNYEHQLRVVSEHVAALNDRLAEKTRRK